MQALPKSGITVFGSQLHTHLRGVRVLTRHLRDGIELPNLNHDDYYSHHYQEIRYLRHQTKVYPVILPWNFQISKLKCSIAVE